MLSTKMQNLSMMIVKDLTQFCEAFENDVIPQSACDSIVPSIAEENAVTNIQGFQTIQMTTEEEESL